MPWVHLRLTVILFSCRSPEPSNEKAQLGIPWQETGWERLLCRCLEREEKRGACCFREVRSVSWMQCFSIQGLQTSGHSGLTWKGVRNVNYQAPPHTWIRSSWGAAQHSPGPPGDYGTCSSLEITGLVQRAPGVRRNLSSASCCLCAPPDYSTSSSLTFFLCKWRQLSLPWQGAIKYVIYYVKYVS